MGYAERVDAAFDLLNLVVGEVVDVRVEKTTHQAVETIARLHRKVASKVLLRNGKKIAHDATSSGSTGTYVASKMSGLQG